MHRKELVKLSSPLLQFTFNKKKTKTFKKICIFEDVDTLTKINLKVTVKAKALSCWIFENVPNENCSLLTEKMTKTEGKISPKILLEKNEERENKMSAEKERRRRKKKQWLHS